MITTLHHVKEVFVIATKLSHEKQLFCCLYVTLGNVYEAAVKAGFGRDTALAEGIACLRDKSCQHLISELDSLINGDSTVISGLKRLVFGSCADAVTLAFSDELPSSQVMDKLDLFNVSEIKRVKGGGVEIKLFDKLKALEKLYEIENTLNNYGKTDILIEALAASAGEPENE